MGKTWNEFTTQYGNDVRNSPTQAACFPTTPPPFGSIQCVWIKDEWTISAMWFPPEGSSGPADYVAYQKTDRSPLTDADVDSILLANTSDKTWIFSKRGTSASADSFLRDRKYIMRSDGAASYRDGNAIIIVSKRLFDKMTATKKPIEELEQSAPNP